jgi:prevent-host-death family protein
MMVRNISQAKAELSALVREAQKGNEVILAKTGKPVARLVAYRGPAAPRKPGSLAGKIWIAPDFDTLPADMAEGFGMRPRRKQTGGPIKKTLPPAKMPMPRFRSDGAAADYFETDSVAGVWNQLPEGNAPKLAKALDGSIRERHAAAKSPISIQLGPEQIAAAKKFAARKSVGYQTQLRMWIAEGIRREAKRA